jgi:iron complex transport system substrate-binding protein
MKEIRVQSSRHRREDFLFWRQDVNVLLSRASGFFGKQLIAVSFLLALSAQYPSPAAAGAATPDRIVSLAPNMTEILFALGLGDRIVGVTSFCDYPEEARKKPKVGGMSNPSLESVVALKPDIVVMTTDGNPREFEERLRSLNIRTYVSRMRRLSELPEGIRDVGNALGVPDRAEKLAENLRSRLDKLSSVKPPVSPAILFIVWPEPLVVAGPGTVINDAIRFIGARNIASDAKTEYPKYSIEEILRRSPDMILIGDMSADVNGESGIREVSKGLIRRLRILPAVKNKLVYYVSDDLYRLGPRTVQGIEELDDLMGRKQ